MTGKKFLQVEKPAYPFQGIVSLILGNCVSRPQQCRPMLKFHSLKKSKYLHIQYLTQLYLNLQRPKLHGAFLVSYIYFYFFAKQHRSRKQTNHYFYLIFFHLCLSLSLERLILGRNRLKIVFLLK
jgi:hypothetical protein